MPRPSPVAPSTAHWRSGHWAAQASNAAGVLLSTTSRIGGWVLAVGLDRYCGE